MVGVQEEEEEARRREILCDYSSSHEEKVSQRQNNQTATRITTRGQLPNSSEKTRGTRTQTDRQTQAETVSVWARENKSGREQRATKSLRGCSSSGSSSGGVEV